MWPLESAPDAERGPSLKALDGGTVQPHMDRFCRPTITEYGARIVPPRRGGQKKGKAPARGWAGLAVQ